MRFFEVAKDGGPDSHVTGFFLIEIKSLFSVVILKFAKGTREAFHSHAFNALTLWLSPAYVCEEFPYADFRFWHDFTWKYTPRDLMHRVRALVDSYAISFRGPWKKTWQEYLTNTGNTVTLTNGRKLVVPRIMG